MTQRRSTALALLVDLYRRQVVGLHDKFSLARPIENDLAALDIINHAEACISESAAVCKGSDRN
jgi:hypothetical protein